MFLQVLIGVSHKNLDTLFTYKIDELSQNISCYEDLIGHRVIVPFGRSNKNIEGYIIDIIKTVDYDESKIKKIISFPDNEKMFTKNQIIIAKWLSEKYFSRLIDCLKLLRPIGQKVSSDSIYRISGKISDIKITQNEKKILSYIKTYKIVSESEILENFGNSSKKNLINLNKNGFIDREQIAKVQDLTIRAKEVSLNFEKEKEIDEIIKNNNKQSKVLKFLKTNGTTKFSDIKDILKISNSPINTLFKNNLIIIDTVVIKRDTIDIDGIIFDKKRNPTNEQKFAIDKIISEYNKDIKKPILLKGVTGSGKTEVYMQIIEKIIKEGKSAIVLVPEISLTPQTVRVFTSRFGEKVSVTHSKLSRGERFDQWKKAKNNEISIIIGPRSAIFTPFDNIGIIIIDEEHENTYKSDTTPKYNTIEVAEFISKLNNCILLLGSATPSVSSFYKYTIGDYELIKMENRVNNNFPRCIISDMRLELAKGNKSIFSLDLQKLMVETLNNDKQIILFLNRRGFSNFVSCRACGYVMECENCNVNYTYHKAENKLICHYCNDTKKIPANCPICGSKYIKHFGTGTQKIEEEIKRIFPNENVLRMDFDTTSRKNSHENILKQFKEKKSRILIGTQMIAKGLDFPEVTLVGVIASDLSLNNGDFRSAEVTYQLITQVIGRSGRSSHEGTAVIQTYNPEHYSITSAKNNNYEEFYKEEISFRRQLNYPPFSNIFVTMFISSDEKNLIILINKLLNIMNIYNRKGFFTMLGPAPCNISKVNNKFRWRIITKGVDKDLLIMFNKFCLSKLEEKENLSNIDINLNINPSTIS